MSTLPAYGIVELLAQSGTLSWPIMVDDEVRGVECKDLALAPLYLERGNASCNYRGLNVADPSLSVDSLIQLAKATQWVVLFLGTDLAGSCNRTVKPDK